MSEATIDLRTQARAWYQHLRQSTTWIPITGVPVRIAGMDPAWRHNAANWLLKRADALATMYSYAELHLDSEPIGDDIDGDPVFMRMPHEVEVGMYHEHIERISDAEAWLKTTHLYQALVKDLPDGIADLARHWSTCNLRTGAAATCSCNDNSPERAL